MDAIYIVVQGESKGPFTRAQVQEMLARGEITPETLAWRDGMANWVPLAQLIGAAAPVAAPPPAPAAGVAPAVELSSSPLGYSRDELRHLATSQGLLMWAVLANILCGVAAKVVPPMVPHGNLIVGLLLIAMGLSVIIFTIYAVVRLGTDLRYPTWAIVLYCLSVFIPCVSLICLVVLTVQASKVLKAAGVRVGLMGGRVDDIPQ